MRAKLYKGNVMITGRSSPYSLYAQDLVTFEDDRGAYDQKDAQGFIKLNALRLRTLASRKRKTQVMMPVATARSSPIGTAPSGTCGPRRRRSATAITRR